MLVLKNIKKHYASALILAIPSLKLENSIYWLKGANGSGKTTLLKILTGLLPFDGDITIDNISIKAQPVNYRKKLGWAEAEPLYPEFLTGTALVQLYCSIRKVELREIDALLQLYNMTSFINEPTGTYSAGMLKKLSLILAFAGSPAWIILDEPFITLDANAEALTQKLILEKHKDENSNFIITSHQQFDNDLSNTCTHLFMENHAIIRK